MEKEKSPDPPPPAPKAGEAEGAVGQLQLDVKHEQARVLAAIQAETGL